MPVDMSHHIATAPIAVAAPARRNLENMSMVPLLLGMSPHTNSRDRPERSAYEVLPALSSSLRR